MHEYIQPVFSRGLITCWHCRRYGFISPKKYMFTTEDAPNNPETALSTPGQSTGHRDGI